MKFSGFFFSNEMKMLFTLLFICAIILLYIFVSFTYIAGVVKYLLFIWHADDCVMDTIELASHLNYLAH